MKSQLKNKILFILTPVLLAIMTWIWLFYKDGRWYQYREEWLFIPFLILHFLLPIFYLIVFFVRIIRLADKNKRSDSDLFYVISSIVLTVACGLGLFTFLIFTSGL